jgi:hypothetical protein
VGFVRADREVEHERVDAADVERGVAQVGDRDGRFEQIAVVVGDEGLTDAEVVGQVVVDDGGGRRRSAGLVDAGTADARRVYGVCLAVDIDPKERRVVGRPQDAVTADRADAVGGRVECDSESSGADGVQHVGASGSGGY